jgi:hypothetical protein
MLKAYFNFKEGGMMTNDQEDKNGVLLKLVGIRVKPRILRL